MKKRTYSFVEEKKFFNEVYNKIQEHYPEFEKPKYNRNLLGYSAGIANWVRWEIRINKTVHGKNFRETVWHEMIHLLDQHIFGTISHGITWKFLMLSFGQIPKRVCTFKLESAKAIRYKERNE